MTYGSVVNCCASRLRDRSLGEAAGLTILIGLLSRPKVFQYFGLPYSGRIAHLAEPEIARLKELRPSSPAGAPAGIQRWHQIRERLNSVPAWQQTVFVRACIDGYSGKQLAEALGCDEQDAAARLDEVMRLIEEIVADKAGCNPQFDEQRA